MSIIYYKTETIWPCIRLAIEHIRQQRVSINDKALRAGLNFSIVLGSACFVEGVFETTLKALLQFNGSLYWSADIKGIEKRRGMNMFYHRLEDELRKRIERSTGPEGYNETFELLAGRSMKGLKLLVRLWEGVTVLFHFRHALAHGREVFARERSGPGDDGKVLERFSGGYREVESYLVKVGLLKTKFVEQQSEYIYLSDQAADHFWQLAQEIPNAIVGSLEGPQKKAVDKALLTQNAFGHTGG